MLKKRLGVLSLNFKRWIHCFLFCSCYHFCSASFWSQWFGLYSQLRSVIKKRAEDIRKLEKRINEIVDRIYKDFSASVGVKNIREYEENQLKAAQELSERRLSLSTQMSKLKYQYVFERTLSLVFEHTLSLEFTPCSCYQFVSIAWMYILSLVSSLSCIFTLLSFCHSQALSKHVFKLSLLWVDLDGMCLSHLPNLLVGQVVWLLALDSFPNFLLREAVGCL